MPTRRHALQLFSRALLTGAALSVLPPLGWAAATFDLLYFDWVEGLDDARDHLGALEEGVLSAEEAAHLQIVSRASGGYAVIYRFLGSEAEAQALATEHAARLAESAGSDEVLARSVPSGAYKRLYNVSYGLGPNFEVLQGQWEAVARMLGSGVAKALYIERTDAGNFALVYKRYGDVESTAEAAKRHARLLKGTGLSASFIEERNNEIVWTGSSSAEAALDPRPVEPDPPEPDPDPPEPDPDPPEPSPETPEPSPETPEPSPEAPASKSDRFGLNPGSSDLQTAINDYVQGLRRRGLVAKDEQTSWLVYDLKRDETVAVINGDAPRQAASMIKPLVMLAFFQRVEQGKIVYGPKSRQTLELMIQKSSNPATNQVIDWVGGPDAVQAVLREHFPRLLPQTSVVEKIAAGGRTYRNKASANDYGRFLRAAWFDRLPRAGEMLRIMNLPGRDRLYYGAPSIPVGTAVYNKTGSTSMLCGDMGILVARKPSGGRVPFVVVGIVEKAVRTGHYTSWIGARSAVIRQVSDLSYQHMRQRHGLL